MNQKQTILSLARALRMARVFLGLKSRGLYFLFLYSLRRFSFCFWAMTMWTRAMDLRITRILESLEAAPPVTCNTIVLSNNRFGQ